MKMKHIASFEQFINESVQVKDFFKDPMNAADVRGWLQNTKLSDDEKKDRIKTVMKDPAKFNDLMDTLSDETKTLTKTLLKRFTKKSVNENITMDAAYIHQITNSGQAAAQDFIDDNNIDSAKLVSYLKQHKDSAEKYDIRDLIKNPDSNKKLLNQFIKESLNEGVWAAMMKGVKSGESGPWSIIAIENWVNGKKASIVGQQVVKIQDAIPAHYEEIKKKYPKAHIHIEDVGGQVVWSEKSNN